MAFQKLIQSKTIEKYKTKRNKSVEIIMEEVP